MRPFVATLPALFLAAALSAQPSAPAAPPAAAESSMARAAALAEAGDLAGAIALLEPLRGRPGAAGPALSLLGALYLETGRARDALAVLAPLAADSKDPAVLFNAGRAARALGQAAEALDYLRRSVALAPASPAGRELGLLHARRGELEEAYPLLRSWATVQPQDLEARMAAAFCALSLGRLPDAEQLLSDLPQDRPRVRLLWAELLLRQGDPVAALAMLQPIQEEHPSELDAGVRRLLAEARLATGDPAGAVAALADHVGEDPAAALILAQAHFQSGDPARAAAALEPFARRLPEKPPAEPAAIRVAVEYGRNLIALGRFADALPPLRRAVALDAADAAAWQLLAQALRAAGQEKEAAAALERWQTLSSAQPSPAERQAAAEAVAGDSTLRSLQEVQRLIASGQPDAALALAQREAKLVPADPRPLLAQVPVLLTLQRADDALAAAEAALRLAPTSADAHYARGAVRMAKRELATAESDLREALRIHPDHVAALNDLAVLLIAQGREKDARPLLERVLALRPDDPAARENLEAIGKSDG